MCDWGRNYHIERNVSEQRGTTMTEPVDSDISEPVPADAELHEDDNETDVTVMDEDDSPEALAGEEVEDEE